MTYALRPNWRKTYGPGDFDVPDDGVGRPLMGSYPQVHEDAEDCINESAERPGLDGDHGPKSVGAHGGSGICPAYSVQDPENVIRLEEATHRRENWYNFEHWIRQIRYAVARTEMVRDTIGSRRVLEYANHAKGAMEGTGFSDDPGWVPGTFAQWMHQALEQTHVGLPGSGIPGGSFNARAAGWVMYGEAMALKVHLQRSPAFALKALETLELAAIPGTGQIIRDANTGGGTLDSVDVQHIDHWGIAAHGAMCLCRRLAKPAPQWVVDGMHSLMAQQPTDYGGSPSPWCFQHTVGGVLVPATGQGQHAAPAHAWWPSNCVALASLQPNLRGFWLDAATRYGPQHANDEQARKESMLLRGALQ